MKTQEQISHSEQNARAVAEGIIEMVAALDRETAAAFFVKDWPLEKCIEVIKADDVNFTGENCDVEYLRDVIARKIGDESLDVDGFEFDADEAQQRIQEDALSVEVRSGWHSPGDAEGAKAEEFNILLTTGGPACRIIGELNQHGEPDRARIEHQDWGTPWTELFGCIEQETLLTYCRQFYFGE